MVSLNRGRKPREEEEEEEEGEEEVEEGGYEEADLKREVQQINCRTIFSLSSLRHVTH